eukprot:9478181-Pyramimonas_sp.AAC.2
MACDCAAAAAAAAGTDSTSASRAAEGASASTAPAHRERSREPAPVQPTPALLAWITAQRCGAKSRPRPDAGQGVDNLRGRPLKATRSSHPRGPTPGPLRPNDASRQRHDVSGTYMRVCNTSDSERSAAEESDSCSWYEMNVWVF